MDHRRTRNKYLLSSENRKLYRLLHHNTSASARSRLRLSSSISSISSASTASTCYPNSTLFRNINQCPRIEPDDCSNQVMTTIAENVNKIKDIEEQNSSRESSKSKRDSASSSPSDHELSRKSSEEIPKHVPLAPNSVRSMSNRASTPCITRRPSIIDGALLEKYMSNKINTYFDKIYVFNMDKRIDRWLNTKKVLDHFHIYNYRRFSGVDGSLHKKEWERHKKKCRRNNVYCDIRSPGAWGILSGMKKLLIDAFKNGYQRILVLQDDIILHNNFNQLFNKNIGKIPMDWNLLYLGCTQYSHDTLGYFNWYNEKKHYYYPNGKTCGAFAVGIHYRVFQSIIKLIDTRFGPFDQGCLGAIQKSFNKTCYVMQPYLVIADLKESDCRSGRNQLTYSKRFKWNLKNFSTIDPYYNNTISIVYITDNSEKSVTKILNSLIHQEIPMDMNLELVIVDNHSEDKTVELIKELMKKMMVDIKVDDDDSKLERVNIKLYTSEYKFDLNTCYNVALGVSDGYYITFQDNTYLSNKNRIQKQYMSYRNEILVEMEDDKYIPETLFFNRVVLNRVGYIEHSLKDYLHKLLIKFHHNTTHNLIKWIHHESNNSNLLDKDHPTNNHNYHYQKLQYYGFIKDYNQVVTKDNLPQLLKLVNQAPFIISESESKVDN